MKLIYVKTDEIGLDSFLNFCFNKLSKHYRDFNVFNKQWRNKLKQKYVLNFQNSDYIIINERGQYIGCLEIFKVEIKSGIYIWTIDNIDLISPYDEEYFDFDKYENVIDDDKYFINRVGFNKFGDWIYFEIENKYTHYRNFLINLKNFTNIKKYIRQEKIKNLLDNI